MAMLAESFPGDFHEDKLDQLRQLIEDAANEVQALNLTPFPHSSYAARRTSSSSLRYKKQS